MKIITSQGTIDKGPARADYGSSDFHTGHFHCQICGQEITLDRYLVLMKKKLPIKCQNHTTK